MVYGKADESMTLYAFDSLILKRFPKKTLKSLPRYKNEDELLKANFFIISDDFALVFLG